MLFQSSNCQDIEKYFRNTFVKLKEFGDELFLIQQVHSNRVIGLDQTGDLFELWLSDDHPYEVDYVLPSKTVYQNGELVTLLQRIPARQYKRGLCADNTQLVDVLTGESLPVDMDNLICFVNKPRFFTLDNIIDGQCPKSAALNGRMSYHSHDKSIRCDHKVIGSFDVATATVRHNKLFTAEIAKLVSNCIKPIKVYANE